MVIGTLYDALIIAFALSVWASAGGKRTLRIAAGLLFGYGLLGVAWRGRLPRCISARC
jgi:hypothetical protein